MTKKRLRLFCDFIQMWEIGLNYIIKIMCITNFSIKVANFAIK